MTYLVRMCSGRRLVALFLIGTLGCFSYVRSPTPEPTGGQEVRAELTDNGTVDMARVVGPGVTALRGNVAGMTSDSLSLRMTSVEKRNGSEEFWAGEMVTVPTSEVARLSVRKLSPGRTALFVSALVGASWAVVAAIVTNNGVGGGTSPKPPPGQ